jgi:uncharacterized membrane protein YuzA (DUF378 family)
MGEGFSVFDQDAEARVWTRIAHLIIGLSYVALALSLCRRLIGPRQRQHVPAAVS